MSKNKFAGHLSRINWGGADLQVQTELRVEPTPRVLTILVRDGEVLSRIEKPWTQLGNQIQEQLRVSSYHERLTRALHRLYVESWIKLDDVGQIAERLARVALRLSGSISSVTYSLLPGALWTSVVSKNGEMVEMTPASSDGPEWNQFIPKIHGGISALAAIFGTADIQDINLKTASSYLMVKPREDSFVVAEVEIENFPEAKQILGRLTGGEQNDA